MIVDDRNGEFAHCPYPEDMGETGYYLLHDHHQQQGILQSKDVGKCCFFIGYAKRWLLECEFFPDNYFELWDIYETYANDHCSSNGKKVGENLGKRMVAEQKGIHNPEFLDSEKSAITKRENGRINGKKYGKKNLRFAYEVNKKQVEVTFANGAIGVYPSVTFAAIAIGVSHAALSNWCSGKSRPYPKRGILKVQYR